MAAVPPPRAIMLPLASTVATRSLLLVHVITRPVSGRCDASSATAVNCAFAPTTASTWVGEMTTLATVGMATVMAATAE